MTPSTKNAGYYVAKVPSGKWKFHLRLLQIFCNTAHCNLNHASPPVGAWFGPNRMWNDLKLALRQLRLNRAFAFIAVATLALGIGANTAIFTVMNTIMFRPLPYKNSDQLVVIHRTSPQSDSWPHAIADYVDIAAQSTVFEKTAAYTWHSLSLSNPGEPAQSLRAIQCTADFFSILGTPAALGRTFAAGEDEPGRNNVVIISHAFWTKRFGADQNIIGKKIRVDGEPVEVIGVMPPSFEVELLWSPI